MADRIAKPVVKDKFWVVEDHGTRVATIQATVDGGFVYVHDDEREHIPSLKVLKQKYPDCTVIIPSPECIGMYFSPDSWLYRHANPFNNVIEIFKNNPYVDGMIDYIPQGVPVYHDHFRIYNEDNIDIPNFELGAFSFKNVKDKIPTAIVNVELTLNRLASVSGKRIFITLYSLRSLSLFLPPC
jgi:hypothetical protein